MPAPSKRKPWRKITLFLIHKNLLSTSLLSTELLTGTLFLSTPCFRKFRKWEKKKKRTKCEVAWICFENCYQKKQHTNFQNIPSTITASISAKACKDWFNLVCIIHLATLGLCFYSEIKFTEHWKIRKKQDVLNTCCTLLKM